MNRSIKILVAIQTAMLLFTGCGTGNSSGQVAEAGSEAEASEEVSEETSEGKSEGSSEEASEDISEADEEITSLEYDDPGSLPKYTYQGTEDYMDVISDFLIKYESEINDTNLPDVLIPYGIIVQTDDADPDDIIAYGIYGIDGYDLLNTTLETATGSMTYGAIHLKKNDDGTYEVTSADLPLVDEESIELFAPVKGLYEKVIAVPDNEIEDTREEAIAGYVNSNGLNITQWQDYSHDPVLVLNATGTPEEAQFYCYESPLGYQITYDLREFSLLASDEDDMYGKVRDNDTSTLMVIKKSEEKDADAAIGAVMSDFDEGTGGEIKDAKIGDVTCRMAEYDEKLEDGRIFRYLCYAVPTDDEVLMVILETTCENEGSGMSAGELEDTFKNTLSTFSVVNK